MPKTVQLPYELFLDLVRFHLTDEPDEFGDLSRAIETGLHQKVEAIIRHNLYTQYKTAADPVEQEQARQAYLDAAGIHPDWRWKQGYDPSKA